jgi:DNA-binding MurR/RpiR family transcriptional regulator
MGPAEKKIADYIITNLNEITVISISELAEKCGCGDATVVRFSRRLGFEGF